jgi:preprotein translocase subunit SecB
MNINTQPKLSFNGVDIVNVNFIAKTPRNEQEPMNVSVECEPTIILHKNKKDVFNILMKMKVENKKYFEITLHAIGKFQLSEDITDEIKTKFLTVNAPAIMFPYVRAFISTLTANLGDVVGTLSIPPQLFSGNIPIVDSEE